MVRGSHWTLYPTPGCGQRPTPRARKGVPRPPSLRTSAFKGCPAPSVEPLPPAMRPTTGGGALLYLAEPKGQPQRTTGPRLQPGTGRAVSPQCLWWPRLHIREYAAFLAQQRGRAPQPLSFQRVMSSTPPHPTTAVVPCVVGVVVVAIRTAGVPLIAALLRHRLLKDPPRNTRRLLSACPYQPGESTTWLAPSLYPSSCLRSKANS